MNEILAFLSEPIEPLEKISNYPLNEDWVKEHYAKFRSKYSNIKINVPVKNDMVEDKPLPRTGQIWTCFQTYDDYFGNEINGKLPYYVVVIDEVCKLDDFESIRIQPINLFVELRAKDEQIISNKNIAGFEFFIEHWNEQPISVNLLNLYIGSIQLDPPVNEEFLNLSDDQKKFREIEIENTSYLRQSVISFLSYKEIIANKGNCPIINIDNYINYLVEKNDAVKEDGQPYELLIAAKRGKKDLRKRYHYSHHVKGEKMEIELIKDRNTFILSIATHQDVILKDERGNSFNPIKSSNNTIFKDLDSGLYILNSEIMDKPIKIRL